MAGLFNKVPTDLDLNGPILSLTTEPTGVTGIGTTVGATGGASVAITGVATAVVGSSGTGGTGYLSYQWYEDGVGALSDGTYITGTASTGTVGSTATLTLSNLITPTDNNRKFYLEVDYVPSYVVGVQSVTVPGFKTGNAFNEPITSGVATVTVSPLIDIVAQPTNRQVFLNTNTTVSVNADLTDSSFTDDLTFQWYVDGEEVSDGTLTSTTVTGAATSAIVENYYTTESSHTFPSISISDVEITVAGAQGGHGGLDGGGPGGNGGKGASGKFFFDDNSYWVGKKIDFYIGQAGSDGTSGQGSPNGGKGGKVDSQYTTTSTDSDGQVNFVGEGNGGRGGGPGYTGWSGGGAGGGAASYVELAQNDRFIVAGGGGGGGGGSHNRQAPQGDDAGPWVGANGHIDAQDGKQGANKGDGDGGGGGGGGGGAGSPGEGAAGGAAGQDNSHGGEGGAAGQSKFDMDRINTFVIAPQANFANSGNGYVNLKYTGYTDDTVTTVRNTTISGSTSANLTIASDLVGIQTCMCKISSATASNSPIYTDTVNVVFNSTATNNNINVEGIGIGITATLATLNLANGDFTVQTNSGDVSTGQINNEWVLYSPDKDMDVEMDLYGGKGNSVTDNNGVASPYDGGEGGYSRIRFTMKQNEEYVIAGLTTSINTPFIYHKGTMIACVGQGGQAGLNGDGGFGGGVDIAGQGGNGSGGGTMGQMLNSLPLAAPERILASTSNGIFGSHFSPDLIYTGDTQAIENNGGLSLSCTKGVYWAQQGIGACDDIGTGQFRLSDGTSVTNTTTAITRGYKTGYNIIQTAGGGAFYNGSRGGNGYTGGQGGEVSGASGGGGSGYTDGSVTVVSATLGGSTEDAKVVLRLQS